MTDLNEWIATQINAAIPSEGRWQPKQVATELVERLRAEHPEQFEAWMTEQAASFIRQLINQRHRSERARIIGQSRARAFQRAAAKHAAGDEHALDPYLIPYVVDETSGTRMSLGDMNARECAIAAQPFHRRAEENSMQAHFLEALSRKIGLQRVRDVIPRDDLMKMLASVGLYLEDVA